MSRKIKKKTKCIIMPAVIAASLIPCSLVCAEEITEDTAVLSINGEESIDFAIASTYTRIMQAETYDYLSQMASSYGTSADGIWDEAPDDTSEYKTFGEQLKGESLDALKGLLLSDIFSEDYGVEISDEDMEKIESLADEFLEKTDAEAVSAMKTDKETLVELLRLLTVEKYVEAEIVKDADTDVSDEEAAQSTFGYAYIYKDNEDQKDVDVNDIKKKLDDGEDFDAVISDAGLVAQSISYSTASPEEDEYDKTMLEHACKLKDGESVSYEDEKGNTVIVYMKATNDKEATEQKKTSIINKRKTDLYNDTVDGWKETFDIEVNEDAWDEIEISGDEIYRNMSDASVTAETNDPSVQVTAEYN